jgi:recombination protein RecT
MTTDLATLDTALTLRRARLAELLPPDFRPERLLQGVKLACWRSPDLLACTLPSLIGAVYDAATLGVECGGTTGQGYLVRRARLIVGSRGVVMIAARADLVVRSGVVMEGDEFSYSDGVDAHLHHVPNLTLARRPAVLAAWATAIPRKGGTPIVSVVPRWRLEEIKARSPSSRKSDSPWNDIEGPGFAGMCQKSAIRPLLKILPVVERQKQAVGHVGLGDSADQDQPDAAGIGTTRPHGRAATRRPTTIVDIEELPPDPTEPEPDKVAMDPAAVGKDR